MAENVKKFQTFDGVEHDIEDTTAREGLNNVYTKSEADALLANKVDSDEVYSKAVLNAILDSKADEDNVYSKAATDDLLAAKANAADVYTKTEADTALALKADAADVYTKTEADTLLGAKANSADVYTITQTDALLDTKASIDDTATTSTMVTWSADKSYTEFQNTAKKNIDNKFSAEQNIVSPNIDSETQADTVGNGLYFENNDGDWMGGVVPKYIASEGEYDLILEAAGGDLNVDTHNFYFHGTGEFIVQGHETVGFPNYSDVLYTFDNSHTSYTATNDSWLLGVYIGPQGDYSLSVNGLIVATTTNQQGNWNYCSVNIPLKSGDVVSATGVQNSGTTLRVLGMK